MGRLQEVAEERAVRRWYEPGEMRKMFCKRKHKHKEVVFKTTLEGAGAGR